jgi:hypothetical protein
MDDVDLDWRSVDHEVGICQVVDRSFQLVADDLTLGSGGAVRRLENHTCWERGKRGPWRIGRGSLVRRRGRGVLVAGNGHANSQQEHKAGTPTPADLADCKDSETHARYSNRCRSCGEQEQSRCAEQWESRR